MGLPASHAMTDPPPDTEPDWRRHTQGTERIRRRFPAGDMETRTALQAVCDGLRRAGLSEDDLSSAELILAEVLNNIVEHAYASGDGIVDLCIELRGNGLLCLIRDHGNAMPNGRPPCPPLPRINPPSQLPEGGFGWHIIRALTTQLHYRQEKGWNVLSFTMPLTGGD